MADRPVARARRRRAIRALALPALVFVALAALAGPNLGGGVALGAFRPGESCPDVTAAPGASGDVCEDTGAPDGTAGAGFQLGGLLPLVGVVVAAGAGALVVAYFVLRRRAGPPLEAQPGDWWTCPSCGATNVTGSPRCYACGTWRG